MILCKKSITFGGVHVTRQTISSFLKQLRKTSGFSANEVVNKLQKYDIDISAKTLYGYESGLSMLNADAFVALCRIYKCDNPMDMFGTPSISSKEYNLVEKYRTLDTHGKDMVNTVLNKEAERMTELESSQATVIDIQPHLEVNAAHARTDIDVTDEMIKHDDDIMDDDDF